MGHIAHQALSFKGMPRMIAIIVVIRHILTKTKPTATGFLGETTSCKTKKAIKAARNSHLNQVLRKILGIFLRRLNLLNIKSKNAPLGQRCEHQNLPLK
jgi:hypothetical protein